MKRILVVQLGDIGDLVLSTPALSALRQAHPNAHIAVLTPRHAAPVLAGTGLADEIIEQGRFPGLSQIPQLVALARRLRGGHYDATLFFHHFTTRAGLIKFAALAYAAGSRRRIGLDAGRAFFLTERRPDDGFGARHQAAYWLDLVALLGADATPRPTVVGISDADRAYAVAALGASDQPAIVIHAGSGGDSYARRWSPEDFAQVAEALAADGMRIVLVGGPGDDTAALRRHLRADCLDLTGQTTLGQLAAVIDRASLFLGADSGVMHVASATSTPIIAIFGPSNPAAWSPWRPNDAALVLRSAPECSPCSYIGHSLGQREGCAARTCMRLVTPDTVIASARRVLSGARSPNEASIAPPLPKPRPAVSTVSVLGLPVSVITFERWLDQIAEWVQGEHVRHVCTINPEMVMIARRDPIFRVILERADLTVPDGVGLLWAARRLGTPLPERVTGSDGVPLIAQRAARDGWRLFFLGAAEGVATRAADVLRQRYPGVQIVDTVSGSPAPPDEDALVARINASGADILFVAYGAPEQDKWIARNLPRLKVRMAMGVGGSFDFVAGVIPRAPEQMRRLGLEWLYRLYLQPWRIKRMLRLPAFVLAVLRFGAKG